MFKVRSWISSSEGRLLRNRFKVRLCKWEGVELREVRRIGDTLAILSISIMVSCSGREGEPKGLEELESSDSERFRLSCIVRGFEIVEFYERRADGWKTKG